VDCGCGAMQGWGLGMCGLKNGDFLAIVQRSFDTYLLLVVGGTCSIADQTCS
jgi:hypothetical protein